MLLMHVVCRTHAQNEDQYIKYDSDYDAGQRPDPCGFAGPGLCVLPDKKQDQADQGDAAPQKAPQESAVVHGGRHGSL